MEEMREMDIPELDVDITRPVLEGEVGAEEENVSAKPTAAEGLDSSVRHDLSGERAAEEVLPEDSESGDIAEDSGNGEKEDGLAFLQEELKDMSMALKAITKSLDQQKMQIQSVDSANRQLAEETRRSLNSVLQVNDRLHMENQKLKDDMYSQMLKPVLMGLCQVANNINKDIKKEMDEKIRGKLLDIRDDVVEVCMSNLGVEVYEPKAGEEFDEMRHRLVKSVATDDENKHRKIQEVLGQGFLWRKNSEIVILEPCKVNVYNVNHSRAGI